MFNRSKRALGLAFVLVFLAGLAVYAQAPARERRPNAPQPVGEFTG